MALGGPALGAVAPESAIRDVVMAGGFTQFRRATETPFNRIFEARRRRDFVPWDDLLDAGEDEPTSISTESDAAASARTDPATIDPQLRKALEHLQQKINATEPGRV